MSSLGWEIQAAAATSVSSASIYNQVTLLAQALDENEVDNVDRHFTVPAPLSHSSSSLRLSSLLALLKSTPERSFNGRVMRVGAFDVHLAVGSRVSTRVGKSTTTIADNVMTTGVVGYQMIANHTDSSPSLRSGASPVSWMQRTSSLRSTRACSSTEQRSLHTVASTVRNAVRFGLIAN
jgi:hypothetical protein